MKRNRWFSFDDLKTLGLILIGVLIVLAIGWVTMDEDPQFRDDYIEGPR